MNVILSNWMVFIKWSKSIFMGFPFIWNGMIRNDLYIYREDLHKRKTKAAQGKQGNENQHDQHFLGEGIHVIMGAVFRWG